MKGTSAKFRWGDLVLELVSYSSKTQLGKRINVSQKEVSRWIKGEAQPHGDHKDAIITECERVGVNWRKYQGIMPVYDFRASYERNVHDGPQGLPTDINRHIPRIPTHMLDFELNSPLGIPASNLTLNSEWISPFTKLGFDIITAKTVRTVYYPSHPAPNVVYLPDIKEPLRPGASLSRVRATSDIPTDTDSDISLANSFGMPSSLPESWQEDLHKTKQLLQRGQILIASVVGTPRPNQGITHLINDYVECARLAHEIHPHFIEPNFSCPNVYGQEGSIFHDPELAGRICRQIKKELPDALILIKIGYLPRHELQRLFDATYKFVCGYTAINTLPAPIVSDGQREEQAFSGLDRAMAGVSGVAIRDHGIEVVRHLRAFADEKRNDLIILGVGGVRSALDVKLYTEAGANGVQICSAAQFNPFIAIEIRKHLAREMHPSSKSSLLEKAGVHVPFQDSVSAKAFDLTARVSERTDIPFEVALRALQRNWLNSYLGDLSAVQSAGSAIKTRRQPPSEAQIEAWVRDEYKKSQQS